MLCGSTCPLTRYTSIAQTYTSKSAPSPSKRGCPWLHKGSEEKRLLGPDLCTLICQMQPLEGHNTERKPVVFLSARARICNVSASTSRDGRLDRGHKSFSGMRPQVASVAGSIESESILRHCRCFDSNLHAAQFLGGLDFCPEVPL